MLAGADRLDYWTRLFGFGKPTGIDLPGEERGILLARKNYSGSTMGNIPIGHGLASTPMQLAVAYAAIANGGFLRPPHIIDSIDGTKTVTQKGVRIMKSKTAASLRNMLEGVFAEGGTASGAAIKGYPLAGKTGTANKPDEYGGYSNTKYYASFAGFAPVKNPRLLTVVMVDEPEGGIYGGQVAGPVFRDISQALG